MTVRTIVAAACTVFAVGISAASQTAQTPQTQATKPVPPERITFKAGATATTLAGPVKSDVAKQYVVSARKGQELSLSVKSPRLDSLVVRVFPVKTPEGSDVFNNFISGDTTWKGPLPADGDYILQIGLRRNEARRSVSTTYTIDIGIK